MKKMSTARLLLGSALLSMAGMASANNLDETSTIGSSTSYQYYTSGGTASSSGTYAPGHQVSDLTAGTSFLAYCIDPLTSAATTSSGNYSITTLANFLNGSAAASPYSAATYANQVARTTSYATLGVTATASQQAQVLADIQDLYSWAYTGYVTNGTAAQRAAFGFALWEIILQNGGSAGTTYGAGTGTLRVYGSSTTSSTDAVDTALSNLLGALNSTATTAWTSLGLTQTTNWVYTVYYDTTTPYTQTYLTVSAGTTPRVPEPGSLALAAVALAAVGVARSKKARA